MDSRLFALLTAALLTGCGQSPITECADARGIHAICGLQNPEDLALLDDGRTLVVGQFGSVDGTRAGNLALLDLPTEKFHVAFRGADEMAPGSASAWGDPACPGFPEAAFSPHGIDVALRTDGRLSLLVVNHGGRESVEFFEISGEGEQRAIHWRGCVQAPDGALMNDVVHLPEGGFLVTRMMNSEGQLGQMLKATLGRDTGHVYEWRPGTGFRDVPGTAGPMPNGIELSPDASEIFLNLYSGSEVVRVSRETGKVTGSVEVAQPDNSTWGRDGRLLVASHTGSLADQMRCMRLESGSCPLAFEIVAIDPGTLETEVVFANEGPPMGAGTVAVDLGDELVIGTFAGDRLIRATRRLPAAP
jgi:hypothetical protein